VNEHDAIARIKRLSHSINCADEIAEVIERLIKERDEARRSCCEYAAIVDGADTTEGMKSGRFYKIAMNYMKDRGWDCFKENGK
jgi:hypothetical protein